METLLTGKQEGYFSRRVRAAYARKHDKHIQQHVSEKGSKISQGHREYLNQEERDMRRDIPFIHYKKTGHHEQGSQIK